MRSGELQENRTGIPNYRIAGTYLFSRPYVSLLNFTGLLMRYLNMNTTCLKNERYTFVRLEEYFEIA